MNRIAIAMVGGVLGACAGGQPQTETLVRQASIEDRSVVLEKCRVRAKGSVIAVGRCWKERMPLPVVTRVERVEAPCEAARGAVLAVPPPPAASTARRRQVAAAITPGLRDALERCAAVHRAGASVRLRVVIDPGGAVSAVEPDPPSPALVGCAREALAAARFPPSAEATTFSLHLAAPVDIGEVAP
jgi:hypothetical protein